MLTHLPYMEMKTYQIVYQRHELAGLFAATSPDLDGFMVVGKTFNEVVDDVLVVAADLIRKRTGEVVDLYWGDGDEPETSASGFIPISSEVRTRGMSV